MNRKFLLLNEEEYPNPCDPVCYREKHHIHTDLGEVVKINNTNFALTTPSPSPDKVIRLHFERRHPS
jgi:hypothetical protein